MGVWEGVADWALNGKLTRGLRERRYTLFMQACDVRPGDRIIDVGAGGGHALERFNNANDIVAVDLPGARGLNELALHQNVQVVEGDGVRLPFTDNAFDVAFSNSVIEHVPDQAAFAREIRRVAGRYFVQTPNKWFPVEPHYQLPLIQFLPAGLVRRVNAHVRLGHELKGSTDTIKLLSARELQRLFPDATIHREKMFGLTKSLMAVR